MANVAPDAGRNPDTVHGGHERKELGWLARVATATITLLLGFASSLVAGKASLADWVKDIDGAVLDGLLAMAEAVPGLQRVAQTATDLGAMKLDYGFAFGLAVVVGVALRDARISVLVVGTLFGSHLFQWATQKIVDGTVPAADLAIGGAAGPYFSGGTARVALLFGMALTLALTRTRRDTTVVWTVATFMGVFEGMTRLVLGRHWPIDAVAGLVIGLGFLWIFRLLSEPLLRR